MTKLFQMLVNSSTQLLGIMRIPFENAVVTNNPAIYFISAKLYDQIPLIYSVFHGAKNSLIEQWRYEIETLQKALKAIYSY